MTKKMNKTFAEFECNEDLFYTIYDYLRFGKPDKWKDIHTVDDFDLLLAKEMKDLANDAVNWLETEQLPKINIWDKNAGAPVEWSTLYYMSLAHMFSSEGSHPSTYEMTTDELNTLCTSTISWLRSNIEKI